MESKQMNRNLGAAKSAKQDEEAEAWKLLYL